MAMALWKGFFYHLHLQPSVVIRSFLRVSAQIFLAFRPIAGDLSNTFGRLSPISVLPRISKDTGAYLIPFSFSPPHDGILVWNAE